LGHHPNLLIIDLYFYYFRIIIAVLLLTRYFNLSFKSGLKKGDQKSYRPILNTSCVSKLFEAIMKKHLAAFVEKNDLLPQSQH